MTEWHKLYKGAYGMEAVAVSEGVWYARDPNFDPSPVLGRPLKCLRYYRQDFGAKGAIESRILVVEDGTFKVD